MKQIYCMLTERCNLSCPICIRGTKSNDVLSYDEFERYVSPLAQMSDMLVLTGGEPLCSPFFYDILNLASSKFKRVSVATNGTIPIKLEKIRSLKNVVFQFSLDGDRYTHNNIRGAQNYERTLSTINTFEQAKIDYCVSTTINKSNKDYLLGLIGDLRFLSHMTYWKVSNMLPFGNATFQSVIDAQEWNRLVDYLFTVTPFKMRISKQFDFDIYDSILSNQNCDKCNQNCGTCKSKFYLSPKLDVFPCTCMKDLIFGNLKQEGIDEIFSKEEFDKISNYKVKDDSACYNCKYLKLCNGGCIGMSKNFWGYLGGGDIRCPMVYAKFCNRD